MQLEDFERELLNLGKRIRQLRKFRKFRLLDLEMLSGVNDSDISRYERGKENIEFLTIFKLARALNVEVKQITDYNGPLPESNAISKSGNEKKSAKKKR